MADVTWAQSEITFLNKIVNSTEGNARKSKWAPIARAMNSEQPKHLRGGELFEQDPWPRRVYTPQKVYTKWRSSQRDAQIEARVQEIAASKALEETKVARENLETTLKAMEDMAASDGRGFPSISEQEFVEELDEEWEFLKELDEEWERLNEIEDEQLEFVKELDEEWEFLKELDEEQLEILKKLRKAKKEPEVAEEFEVAKKTDEDIVRELQWKLERALNALPDLDETLGIEFLKGVEEELESLRLFFEAKDRDESPQ
ncbi:hypothetical protein OCU04_012447 [Sclerotinia nivalis]|uniref:Uncharacterized protein n=1 Tax=Sclerotinia nivalis TaxID=352851 RepID=A0A9X0A9T1_9HELO|nr:hypothetical protein OCU04_012447 [Sclerotinia nivalis]